MDITRNRLVIAACGFTLLFGAVTVKLAAATVVFPMQLRRLERSARVIQPSAQPGTPGEPGGSTSPSNISADGTPRTRAMITDRNGVILAISLPTAQLFANPKEMIDPVEAAHRIKSVLPQLDEGVIRTRLSSGKQFVYLARQLTPRDQLAVNALGIPGVYFQPTERRRYPLGRVGAHVVGNVDVDAHGIAGVERQFDQRLREDSEPLRLSLDVRVQAVVRDELSKAIADFNAIGGAGIVEDVRTGEVVAMVSLPDFDANKPNDATGVDRFNRAVTGVYEPGSTFKLQDVALALDTGTVNIWNGFDASSPIRIGRFSISDFEGKHRYLQIPEIIAYSSNIGAAHMAAAVGSERQQTWMRRMGMFDRLGIELPEVGRPIHQPSANWKEVVTMTVGFGHGIAVTPLHVVAGTAAIANGGVYMRPTILAPEPGMQPRTGERLMQQSTSDTTRKLMRLVVTEGYGKPAEVPGYYVGGKTGTAEKTSAHGYKKHSNVAAFMSVFPMQAPRYAVYMMLDEPKANASTHGYATAGWVAAPAAGRVIARIGPMLGLMPELANKASIDQSLFIPLQPGRPAGGRGNPPAQPPAGSPGGPPVAAASPRKPGGTPVPAPGPAPAPARDMARDPAAMRHEAEIEPSRDAPAPAHVASR